MFSKKKKQKYVADIKFKFNYQGTRGKGSTHVNGKR